MLFTNLYFSFMVQRSCMTVTNIAVVACVLSWCVFLYSIACASQSQPSVCFMAPYDFCFLQFLNIKPCPD